MEFRQMFISIMLIGLIAFAMMVFIVQTQLLNNAPHNILENQGLNKTYTNLQQSLIGSQNNASDAKTGFESDSSSSGVGEIIFNTIIGSGKIFTGTITTMFIILSTGLSQLFGISEGAGQAVLATFTTIFVVSIILLLWSVYKAGR